jgi:small subunit ribosomal protein S8
LVFYLMQHSVWNMYSAIRNGSKAHRKSIFYPRNSLCVQVLTVLYREGYINGFRTNPTNQKDLEIFLKYSNGKPVLKKIISSSKPGRRIYTSVKTLWKLDNSLSTVILSTSKGLLSDKDCRKLHLGGEVFCMVL